MFLDQTNFFQREVAVGGSNETEYFDFGGEEGGVLIQIYLQSKSSIIKRNFPVLSLTLQTSHKRQKESVFQVLTQVLNDDPKTLKASFLQLTKQLISFCFFSPYLNFSNNNYSPKINLIKKKFFLDYQIEQRSVADLLKENPLEDTDS